MSSRQIAALGVSLFAMGCNERLVLPVSTVGGESSSGTSGGHETSSGSASSTGGGSGTASGTSAGSGSTGAASGTSSGGSVFVSPYFDGGYVSCDGRDAAGASVHWTCPSGTYFCDPGLPGNCFQCLSDRDCAVQSLPTYDPDRLRCDLDSGVAGYQNFCQQCTTNADCASNPGGPFCDLNPSYPPNSLQPAIDTLGFETCTSAQTDCRLDGGPTCREYNQFCNPDDGQCVTRSGKCQTDQDCAGVFSPYSQYLLAPYCIGGTCGSCDGGGICPEMSSCLGDAQCRNPGGSPSGLSCDPLTNYCGCTDDSQCEGFWPVCLPFIQDGGANLGTYCGCQNDAQCGDAGLACLLNPISGDGLTGVCGIPCTSPLAPECARYACDVLSGLCEPCQSDIQCQLDPLSSGPICDDSFPLNGNCGCRNDGDCSTGKVCVPQQGYKLGACSVELTRCTPDSCGYFFCDWDSGNCLAPLTPGGPAGCFDDYDCANQLGDNTHAAFCQSGLCVQCLSNLDCRRSGAAASGGSMCCLPGEQVCADHGLLDNTCNQVCASDQDCIGNYYGPSCTVGDAGLPPHCGCASDADCGGNSIGLLCDREPSSVFYGSCVCQVDSDCPIGVGCGNFEGNVGTCSYGCFGDAGCAPGYTCDPGSKCRPRCDPGHSCAAPDLVCDRTDLVGHNGDTNVGSAPGVTWCYGCLQASDCAGGVGCDPVLGCGSCRQSSDCPSGKACIDGGVCQPKCVDGGCPPGEVCDSQGQAGYGPNVCFGCVGPADCPNGEGCDSLSHTCGACEGPTALGGPFDCPPDAVCSNFWRPSAIQPSPSGVCLNNCDRSSCPADQPICAVMPALTPDHKYCFGCLGDSDCSDAGSGAYCNDSPEPTFTCRPPVGQ